MCWGGGGDTNGQRREEREAGWTVAVSDALVTAVTCCNSVASRVNITWRNHSQIYQTLPNTRGLEGSASGIDVQSARESGHVNSHTPLPMVFTCGFGISASELSVRVDLGAERFMERTEVGLSGIVCLP